MRISVAVILTVLLTASLHPAAVAGDLLPSIQRIVDRGTLVIAVVDGARPPMISRDEAGKLSGFDADLGSEIAEALGVKPEFVAAGPHTDDIIDMVAAGRADIGLSYLSESIEGAKRVFFSQPYMIEAHTVFINRVKGTADFDDCPRISDLRRLARTENMLGISTQGPYAALFDWAGEDLVARRYDDIESLAAAVEAGDVAVSLQSELAAKFYLSRHPEAFIRLSFCNVAGSRHRVSVAVRPDGHDLLRWLDLYITQRGVIIDLDTLIYRADRTTY